MSYKGRRRRRTFVVLSVLLVLAVLAAIFFFSAQTADDSSRLSGAIMRFLLRIFVPGYGQMTEAELAALHAQWSFWVRKAAHFTEFAALGFSWRLLFLSLSRRPPEAAALLWSWLLSTLYAVTDELHQMLVEGRGPSVRDVCIDSAGALCGALLLALIAVLAYRGRRRR